MMQLLPVKLTPLELEVSGSELAKKVKELAAEKEAAKDMASAAKERANEIEKELRRLAEVVSSKSDYRQVECREIRNDPRRTMDMTRQDTFEVISSRPMNQSEMTRPLFAVEDQEDGTVTISK